MVTGFELGRPPKPTELDMLEWDSSDLLYRDKRGLHVVGVRAEWEPRQSQWPRACSMLGLLILRGGGS